MEVFCCILTFVPNCVQYRGFRDNDHLLHEQRAISFNDYDDHHVSDDVLQWSILSNRANARDYAGHREVPSPDLCYHSDEGCNGIGRWSSGNSERINIPRDLRSRLLSDLNSIVQQGDERVRVTLRDESLTS